ncbi:MAG: hypothetical protein M0R03_06665 [Novosphingobium sp.]|nr:hypothetical protein [Novosphingobium sp.]
MSGADQGRKDGSDGFGALVGWTGERLGDKVVLKMESVRSAPIGSDSKVDNFQYFLTRSQAAVLANYLYEVAGQTPPRYHSRKRSWLGKVLGSAG